MKKRSHFRKFLIIVTITIVSLSLIHYLVFPQQTRSMLIRYSSFKKEGSLYYDSKTPAQNVAMVQSLIKEASDRNQRFWGGLLSQSQFIYCQRADDFKTYGSPYPVPAVTHNKLGTWIVIGEEGVETDIIAHEVMHAELYARIGFFKLNFNIPTWFDEGLAMLSDYRNYYSEDTLKALSDNYKNLPDLRTLETAAQFNSGSREKIMFNYMAAAHEVRHWYTKEKMEKFINAMNNGKSFDESYNQ